MSELLAVRGEPNPAATFCRRFGIELPEYSSLGEIREAMDEVEPQLIDAIAEQQLSLNSMVNSKNELPYSAFIDQYEINTARIKEQAAAVNPGLNGFEELVGWVHRFMLPTSMSIRYDLRRDPTLESRIVGLIAERCRLVRQAAFFKQDLRESSAPARQARNIANARRIASGYADRIPGFENLIEDVYSELVPGSVELQHLFWKQTTRVENPYKARKLDKLFETCPEVWNFGEWDDTADPRVVAIAS